MSTASTKSSGSVPLKIIVGQGKNLISSRRIFCLVNVLDQDQNVIATQKTTVSKGTQNPVWNSTLTFANIGDKFAGISVEVFEMHRVFADKFLGIVRLKFNVKKLESGDDELDTWFTLSSVKTKDKVSGEIHLKVVYGDGRARKTRSQSKTMNRPLEDETTEDSSISGPTEETPQSQLKKSGNWQKKDNMLKKSTFVVIPESEVHKDGGGGGGGKTKGGDTSAPKGTGPKSGGIPKDARGQLELIARIVKETPEGCIQEIVVDDIGNAVLVLVNRKNGKSSQVTLMIPENLERGEFTLWTRDGAYELGRAGSVLHAANKVVESFTRKNGVEKSPVFPEDGVPGKGRKSLLTSGWANLDRQEVKPVKEEKDESSEEGGGGGYLQGEDNDEADDKLVIEEDFTGGKTALMGHVDVFKNLHGSSEIGLVSENDLDFVVRLGLAPSNFLDELMAKVWQVHFDKRIIVELTVNSPYYMNGQKPVALRCYQTQTRSIASRSVDEASFGLQWYLQNRLEAFLKKNWPPKHSHLFLDLMSYSIDKITNCTTYCQICDKRLQFPMLKPSICESPLCLFSHEQFGLGVDPAAEIAASPEVVDILISTTMAAAVGGDAKRFTPFPTHLEVKWKDASGIEISRRFQKNPHSTEPTMEDLNTVKAVIMKFPSVEEMKRFKTTRELKEHLDRIDYMAFPLLRWILTSARTHLAKLKPNERITQISTTHQFLMLNAPPQHEAKFQEEKKRHGSFWAFHGSAFNNWHSILRNSLKNLSNTSLMSTGAVYGAGIYLAADSNTSFGYARAGSGWDKSLGAEGGNNNLRIVAMCEVVNAGYKANPYYVVQNDMHVVTRYLFLFNNQNQHNSVIAANCTIPNTEYVRIKKDVY